jgi:death-on-curing protein
MTMNYLTQDDLLDLHTFAIQRFGGRMGIKSYDQLMSIVAAPQQIMFDEEVYPDLASKVAVIGFRLLKNRPFIAGNEVTALLALLRLLQINGATLADATPEDLATQLRAVLNSQLDHGGLTLWLRERLAIGVEE